MKKSIFNFLLFLSGAAIISSCGNGSTSNNANSSALGSSDVASKVYVEPGEHDEFYAVVSGGFSGQLSFYGLPSMLLMLTRSLKASVLMRRKRSLCFSRSWWILIRKMSFIS